MRLDRRLVALGLAESRARAQRLIEAGAVTVNGDGARKSSALVPASAEITVAEDPCPWVSRAGLKLAHALDVFGLRPEGEALDLGTSTGGFAEVLLARGAARVHGIEVGRGQLHPRLAADPGLILHEGVNARAIPEGLVPAVDWLTADLSFIPLRTALPGAMGHLRSGGRAVLLVKPQFELGPEAVGRGGLVRDPALHLRACDLVAGFLESRGWEVTGRADSPIEGGDGNREFLLAARAR